MEFEHIIYEPKEHIGLLTLNRPEVLNARNGKMRQEIIEACRIIEADPEVRVVIITGSGDRSFSVGRDLKEPMEPTASLADDRVRTLTVRDVHAVASLSKPVIAAINGLALGGGLELALACDIRIAAENAQLGLVEVSRGLMPGSGGTQRLPRLIGKAKALELILGARTIDAREAERIGLVNKVVPKEQLVPAAREMAKGIAEQAPVSVRFCKEAVTKGLDLPLSEGIRLETDLSMLLRGTRDAREGRQAFAEKRKPNFEGK